ncbi:carboxypeptidase-like regulatory domain-containing protein [Tenacibaculum dicentrarchi]|uniref:TonB-dependent receptor n=1 Tax=Tenacibaculum dicentrarchi TaxID=669041 RepID=A0ABM9NQQ6_9FLAO|nr:carboxypeptidase-like regulatory domain-containing protein [Tenacibaculum dicentrarchi]MCD8407187.1 carboxypeptidase-like regulatory domain-containing protein [Tenacibaculum dicentrarchi]MCD8413839.1 carboxypeptidase-like regulatory domain-containing protein [Tenacibaculum dicentrarchi]MCD8419523.1 carboxypeptidase-like regulatory domain-containing protein [Tenacibaculum dicentrarchi]MCD8424538.1 carboxypeptidase-like regulatory domain-containing protein [Tenacibaculum dicentrarchi]
MLKKILFFFLMIFSVALSAQINLKGKVYDEYLDPLPNVSIRSLESIAATTSTISGNFTLIIARKLPCIIQVSTTGYKKEVIQIKSLDQELNIVLKELK